MHSDSWRSVTAIAGGAVFALLFLATYSVLFQSGVVFGFVTRGLTVVLLLWLAYAAWTRLQPRWRTGGRVIAIVAVVIAGSGFLLDLAMAVDSELASRGVGAWDVPLAVIKVWRQWPLVGVAAQYVLRWIIPAIRSYRGSLRSPLATVGLVISTIFVVVFAGTPFVA